jgi:hypothetical protein
MADCTIKEPAYLARRATVWPTLATLERCRRVVMIDLATNAQSAPDTARSSAGQDRPVQPLTHHLPDQAESQHSVDDKAPNQALFPIVDGH